ncbi:MAG: TonB-dependent receptor [Luteolibacter sp.]|jgi:Fe(3+) dicitrate transport protein|nr:TonB-dependent receptor [Luteolibacter sp.]
MKSAPEFHKQVSLLIAAGLATSTHAAAQDAHKTLDAMVVTAESEADESNQQGWLSDVSGAAIFAGKKTAVIDLDAQARIVGNNYRQALSQTPSLLLSEESSPLVSLGYRGLNPHRAQFSQVLRDGIPIHADQFGYPEAYYTPPLDTVDRIEFLHGGAALQHGPQPGGALNFITHRPRTDKEFSLRTQHIVGSDDLYSTFSSADGTVGKLGYYLYFNHRESEGFRSENSDYDLNNAAIKLLYTLDNGGKIILNADTYEENHGEPGGLSIADFNSGSLKATREFDQFSLDRDSVSLTYEIEPTPDSFFTTTAWWSDYTRYSKRQRGGGFGTEPSGPTANSNSIEDQNFKTFAIDSRYRTSWGRDSQHTFSTGIQVYHVDSPRIDSRGATAEASSGQVRRASDREVLYIPVFAENKFTFGDFSITPGIRLENVRQEVDESVNLDKTNPLSPLASKEDTSHILLGGLGLEYATDPQSAIYGNISQSYRPLIFSEAVPLGNNQVVSDDLEEGRSIEYELGYRSRATDWLTWDASVFLLSFKDQIGSVTQGGITSFENVGDSIHKGVDVSVRTDLLGLISGSDRCGSLDWYVNGTLLDAEFTSGPSDGNTPQYAPDFILRTGLNYNFENKIKLSLGGTFLDDHYANDSNDNNFKVPAYMVWDLTAEYKIHENLRLLAGINNLFDESYFARVRSDGIDPANGRNYYIGASLEL